jgi:multidrug efflux pump subunit AcrA (membrane-fusion protein)
VKAVTEPGYAEVTGAVVGDSAVPIATKLFSAITYMGFEEGDPMRKGDVLARIDDNDIQAMRSEAAAYRAEAAGALAEVETVVAQGRAGKAQAEAALAQAEASHSDAVKDFERAERLAAEDSIPRVQRDKAELGVEIAKQGVEQARSAVNGKSVRKTLARILAARGIGGPVSTHSFRKTFGWNIYCLSNYNILVAMRALGHSNPMTTMAYLDISGEEVAAAVGKLYAVA